MIYWVTVLVFLHNGLGQENTSPLVHMRPTTSLASCLAVKETMLDVFDHMKYTGIEEVKIDCVAVGDAYVH